MGRCRICGCRIKIFRNFQKKTALNWWSFLCNTCFDTAVGLIVVFMSKCLIFFLVSFYIVLPSDSILLKIKNLDLQQNYRTNLFWRATRCEDLLKFTTHWRFITSRRMNYQYQSRNLIIFIVPILWIRGSTEKVKLLIPLTNSYLVLEQKFLQTNTRENKP